MKFTQKENRILTEIERRVRYFQSVTINSELLLLAYPSEVKSLIERGYIKSNSTVVKRVLNWFSLTDKGRELFRSNNNIYRKISNELNVAIFEGRFIRNFNKKEELL